MIFLLTLVMRFGNAWINHLQIKPFQVNSSFHSNISYNYVANVAKNWGYWNKSEYWLKMRQNNNEVITFYLLAGWKVIFNRHCVWRFDFHRCRSVSIFCGKNHPQFNSLITVQTTPVCRKQPFRNVIIKTCFAVVLNPWYRSYRGDQLW